MRKITTTLILMLIVLISYSQSNFLLDSGYYYGIVNDSFNNKCIVMSFLSNGEDDQVYIVPYILNKPITNDDLLFIQENFLNSLKQENDSIDGNIYNDLEWSIPGFDNYTYYTVDENLITFSLNIASIDANYINNPILEIFEFKGKIKPDSKKIEAVISSTDSTFNSSTLILTYKNF